MRKRYFTFLILSVPLFVLSFVLFSEFIRKEKIYIKFEDIKDYSYQFEGADTLKPDNILIKQKGKLWYMYWDLIIDKEKVKKLDKNKLSQIEYCSQYWIINNYNGFSMNFDWEAAEKYRISIITIDNNDVYLLPVDKIRCVTQ